MFSSKQQLNKKTGSYGVGRYDYLKQLITEYTTSRSLEGNRQILANLANFAYDPINYEYFKQLHVVDLFLAQLSEDDEDLLHFALTGLCNLSPDPEFRDYIVSLNGIYLISSLLNQRRKEIVLDAISSLYYLTDRLDFKELINDTVVAEVRKYQQHDDIRLRNMSNEKFLRCQVKTQQSRSLVIKYLEQEKLRKVTSISSRLSQEIITLFTQLMRPNQ